MLPTTTTAEHLLDSLAALHRPPKGHPEGAPTVLETFARRLLTALERETRAGSTAPDGFPPSTMGGGRGTGALGYGDPVGQVVAGQLDRKRPPRDHVRDVTGLAARELSEAVAHVQHALAAMTSWADLVGETLPTPRTCEHCTPHVPNADRRIVHRRSTVGDRLGRALDLCEPCYWYVYRLPNVAPGSRAAALPTPEQIRHHNETGKWRLPVTTRPTEAPR